jgi:hypothetical protein
VGFNVTADPTGAFVYPNFQLRLKHTSATTLPAYETMPVTANYSGNYDPVLGWNMLSLSTTFTWDGVSNVIVETCVDHDNSSSWGWSSNTTTEMTTGLPTNTTRWTANNQPCASVPNEWYAHTGGTTNRPRIRFYVPAPMTFVSMTTTQTVVSSIVQGLSNNEIIGIQVVTSGTLSPFALNSLNLTTTGSTNPATDISNYRLYYSGTVNAFGGTLIASGTSLASLTFSPVTLSHGTNYFWLAYDISSSAGVGNVVDAQCLSGNFSGGVGTKTPTVTNPAGNRPIISPLASITTIQASTASVGQGANNQEIIGVHIVTNSPLPAFTVNSFNFSNAGSTNPAADISGYRLYYSGATATFGGTLIASATTLAGLTFTPVTLAAGNNYFWLAYDISGSATIGNVVDAQCLSATFSGTVGTQTPAVTNPAGNRPISTPSFIIGSGGTSNTTGTYPAPFGTYNYGGRHQMVYLASELTAAGMVAGHIINEVGFNVTADPTGAFVYPNFQLRLKHTAATTLPAYETMPITPNYSGNHDPVLGWNMLPLSTTFVWDGVSNIIVETCVDHDNGPGWGWASNTATELTTGLPTNTTRWTAANQPCASAPNEAYPHSGITTNRPRLRLNALPPAPMAFVSMTTTQTVVSSIGQGTNNNQIIGIEVVTSGFLSPINLISLNLTTTGSTNPATDISNYRLYYSGTVNAFGGTLIASGTSLASLTFSPVTLSHGTNYFWLAYDISTTATIGNVVDAECLSATFSGTTGTQIPTVTSPAGNRPIIAPTISGIINNYTQVTSILNGFEVSVSSTAGFAPGDKVLLIQMKGANVDTSNTAAFGSIISLGTVGNYEYLKIFSITGTTVRFTTCIQRSYRPDSVTQLVRIPVYSNVTVTGDLTCQPFNGSTGGILAFEATGTVTLAANLDVSGRGFRGGDMLNNANWSCPASAPNYFYPNGVFNHSGPKGEGIALLSIGKLHGRGANANAGGGGTNVNAGGGGGSNVGLGGFGGRDWMSCMAGDVQRGIGGYGLSYSNIAQKVYLGGGGGAGHAGGNVTGGGSGGNGGGLIIIKANQITTSSTAPRSISSNGANAANVTGQWAGGGGGAGGTILIECSNFTSPGNIEIFTRGGRGGDAWWPNEVGPGGGGGGGQLWISTATLPTTVIYPASHSSGGNHGLWNGSGPAHSHNSTAGTGGGSLFNLSLFDNIIVPTLVTWNGSVDNDWFKPANWTPCHVPQCGISVQIPATVVKPLVNLADGIANDVTVSPGGELHINAPYRLDVCGNWLNNGLLDAQPSSTVRFIGTGLQWIRGNLTVPSEFANLTIEKPVSSTARLDDAADVAQHFLIANSNSTFNTNTFQMRVGGNFTNHGVFNPTSAKVIFNGATLQQYTKTGTGDFYDLIMDGAGGLNLNQSALVAHELTLNNGIIYTNAFEVNVTNPLPTAVTPGNVSSYVNGNLRRAINPTGAYDFPVGDIPSGKGYQRINFDFVSATGYTNLLANFSPTHVGAHPTAAECGNDGYDAWIGNGQWNVTGTPAAPAILGTYHITAYPRNFAAGYASGDYTPVSGNMSATVAKKNGAAPWSLEGVCVPGLANSNLAAATPIVKRNNIMSGFSDFGVVVSDNTPFPVELLTLSARPEGELIKVEWLSGAEVQLAGFDLERSTDATVFNKIGFVASTGSNSRYGYADRQVVAGKKYYYRLKQIDLNGSFKYSNVVEAILPPAGEMIAIYPNPTQSTATVLLPAALLGVPINVQVHDVSGKLVFQQKYPETTEVIELNTQSWAEGIYNVTIQHRLGVSTKSVIRQ